MNKRTSLAQLPHCFRHYIGPTQTILSTILLSACCLLFSQRSYPGNDCDICQEKIDKEGQESTLECKHCFHDECINHFGIAPACPACLLQNIEKETPENIHMILSVWKSAAKRKLEATEKKISAAQERVSLAKSHIIFIQELTLLVTLPPQAESCIEFSEMTKRVTAFGEAIVAIPGQSSSVLLSFNPAYSPTHTSQTMAGLITHSPRLEYLDLANTTITLEAEELYDLLNRAKQHLEKEEKQLAYLKKKQRQDEQALKKWTRKIQSSPHISD